MEEKTKPTPSNTVLNRRMVLIAGGVLLFFGAYISVFLIPDVLATASGPETMTMAHAADIATDTTTYAKIEDGVWDCDTIEHVYGWSSTSKRNEIKFTEVFVTDGASPVSIAMLTQMSGEQSCLDLRETTPTGYLRRMSDDTKQVLTNDARLARYYDAEAFLEFCGYCGQENSMIGAIFGFVFALAGIGLLIFGWRMKTDSTTESNSKFPDFESIDL